MLPVGTCLHCEHFRLKQFRYLRQGLSMDAEVDDILDETGIAPMRLKMRRKLFETLIMGSLDVDRIREL